MAFDKNISKIKIAMGFIGYNNLTGRYLSDFLPSLAKAVSYYEEKTGDTAVLMCWDNSEKDGGENIIFTRENYPGAIVKWSGGNLGFAKTYNIMINEAIKAGAEYFLAINPDMIFEEDFLLQLEAFLEKNAKCGAVQSKILKWDFEKREKTNIVDSLGLEITSDHCFFDREAGFVDANKPGGEIFGFTGAAVLFRISALKDASYSPEGGRSGVEFFDELMFMYKEDADLSYRLRLAGWKIFLESKAVAYHDRTASTKGKNIFQVIKNRRNKSKLVKKWSFLNQWIIILKYRKLPFAWRIKAATCWYQFKSLIFIVFFEQYLLKEFLKLWKIRKEIKKRRNALKIRVNIKDIEKFMK